ncbi:MAG: SDR family NAD(P)-dependent oxidoreductase [Acidimicrobiia bacterium]|nr:SDR family NAD(P)-dependent oxidoreductase [Acidimicrobiia bacterium]MYC45254.1 SDR family NAD(P)-dependent oxidoreductase [Acidimicrobiia bacterium]
MSKVVLITGASSGIGREAAILLGKQGHTVYAGARRVDRLAELADLTGGGVTAVEMDVTKDDDNQRVVDRIIESEGRIDVLINNAGCGLYGPIEDVSLDDARHVFEVNLFGLAHLTQLVLPHMRARRSGRIVNISSMVGRIYTPMGAWYIATKHALEGWSDCLRYETAPFGIQVALVQPGSIHTEFASLTANQLNEFPDDSPYRAHIDMLRKRVTDPGATDRPVGAQEVAEVYVEAATARRPRRRYVTGARARPWMFTRKWLGDRAFEYVLHRSVR